MKLRLYTAVSMLGFAIAAPAMALDPEAPRVTTERGELEDRAILLTGYGHWPDRDNPPLRTAQALVDPNEWFNGSSAVAKAHLANPHASTNSLIILEISPDGRVTNCHAKTQNSPVDDETSVCADIAKQRFLPQLGNDGVAEQGQFNLSIGVRRFSAEQDNTARPLFTGQRSNIPAPMVAPRTRYIRRFPPTRIEVNYLYGKPAWKVAPEQGWGSNPRNAPRTGLILWNNLGKVTCRVVEGSDNSRKDVDACQHSIRTLGPDWSGIERKRDWMVPLYVLHRPDGFVAIGPDPDRAGKTSMGAGIEAALVSAFEQRGVLPNGRANSDLVLYLASDRNGNVIHCRVVTTTGTDAQDITACAIARKTVKMHPREDVFGTPESPAGMFWRAQPRNE